MTNKINWFEIPAANLERAVKFYSQVFRKDLQVFQADEERTVALMPPGAGIEDDIQPGGTLLQTANFEPSATGTVVYFNPAEDMDTVLRRVEAAGGKITFPRFRIGNGYLATFLDSEGNTVGLLEWDED
jgi:predicted enzyme related to lactoylglutathione lyase